MSELQEHTPQAVPELSILIASLEARRNQADELLKVLMPQIGQCPERVELIGYRDNGEKTVGYKRQNLLLRARGDYVCFVDDDDLVDDDYVKAILGALEDAPDCVPLQVHVVAPNGRATAHIVQSRLCGRIWRSRGEHWSRSPNHLNPVKRNLALAAGFADMDAMEDRDYAVRLLPMLIKEALPTGLQPTYIYRCAPEGGSTPNFSPRLFVNRFGGDYEVALRVRGGRDGGTVKVETWPPHINWAGMVVDGQRIGVLQQGGWRSICIGNRTVHTEPWASTQGPTRLKITCDGRLVLRMPPVKFTVGGRQVVLP